MEEAQKSLITMPDLIMEIGKMHIDKMNDIKINNILNQRILEANKIFEERKIEKVENEKIRTSNSQYSINNNKLSDKISVLNKIIFDNEIEDRKLNKEIKDLKKTNKKKVIKKKK